MKLECSSSSQKSLSRNPGTALRVTWLTAQLELLQVRKGGSRRKAMAPFPKNKSTDPQLTLVMPVLISLLIPPFVQWRKKYWLGACCEAGAIPNTEAIQMNKCQTVRRLGEVPGLCHRVWIMQCQPSLTSTVAWQMLLISALASQAFPLLQLS